MILSVKLAGLRCHKLHELAILASGLIVDLLLILMWSWRVANRLLVHIHNLMVRIRQVDVGALRILVAISQ